MQAWARGQYSGCMRLCRAVHTALCRCPAHRPFRRCLAPPVRSFYVRDAAESQVSAVELFLNSVPILSPLSREEKLRLVDAFEQRTYTPGAEVRGAAQEARLKAATDSRHALLHGRLPACPCARGRPYRRPAPTH